jgi:hypothetical protein
MSADQSPAAGNVQTDKKKNRFLTIYLSGLAVAGITLFVLTYLFAWGFWGWFGGGFLLVAGAGGIAGMLKTGGAGKLACPACLGELKVLHISEQRTMPCPRCKTYLEGAEKMILVPKHRVAQTPVFEAPLPEAFAWPEGCPTCGEPATRTVKVEGMSLGGSMAMLMAPVALARVSKVDAPCCDKHKNGVALYRSGGGTIVAFRSYAYWWQFCGLNKVSGSQTVFGVPVEDTTFTQARKVTRAAGL